jgi:hypothetical protein
VTQWVCVQADSAALSWSTGEVFTASSLSPRDKDIGGGIPSKPIVVITDTDTTVTTNVLTATTNQEANSNPATPPANIRSIHCWCEVF